MQVMIHKFLVATLALILTLAGSVDAQQKKTTKVKPTKESKQLLTEAIDALKAAQKEDLELETKRCMILVSSHFEGGDKALKAKALKLLAKQLKKRDIEMKQAVLKALSETGPEASKIFIAEVKKPTAKKSLSYKCEVIAALGRLRDPKSIDYLLKFLHNKDIAVTVAGIEALASYKESETPHRKEIVKELLKFYGPLEGAARMPTAKTEIVRKYNKLRSSFEGTLRAVTGKVDAKNAAAWNRWFRKVGKKLKEW